MELQVQKKEGFGREMIWKNKSREVVLVRVILLLAVVIATISFIRDANLTGFTTSENRTNSLPVWEGNSTWQIGKNTEFVVDLNDYFKDSDNDALTFLATEADKIAISIVDNIMTIVPDAEFAGERTISVLASDGFDAVKVSVKIVVGTEEERSLIPVNESLPEEANVSAVVNVSTEIEANITEENVSNASAVSEALEAGENRSIRRFGLNEKIKDENDRYAGKKVEDEALFETFFTEIEKNESGLLVSFYHNASAAQPVWVEGDIEYMLSNETAEPFQNITLIVPRIKGVIPKFKLHIGSKSDVFEFGKIIPEIIFNGNATLIDRDDEKIDVSLKKENSSAEIIGAYDVAAITAKISQISDDFIRTDVFAADDIPVDNATISLPKHGRVNAVMECPDFNIITDSCPGTWIKADIPFEENETHIIFTVSHFSGYGGAEINILNVQSYPTVGQNWEVRFTTTGTADLIIEASNGTHWSNSNEDYDLKFLELRCGNAALDYVWENSRLIIANYSCSEEGSEVSKVITPGSHTLKFTFGDDIRYAKNFATVGWIATYDSVYATGHNSDIAESVAIDSLNNIIVTGNANVTAFTIKYDENGNMLANASVVTASGRGVAVDSLNNIIVAGYTNASGDEDLFLIKYDENLSQLWNLTYNYSYHEHIFDVAVDWHNNIIASGRTYSTGTQSWDYFVVKYNENGTALYNSTWKPSHNYSVGVGVAVDSLNNVIVTGYALTESATYVAATVKFDENLTHIKNTTFGAANAPYYGWAVAVDDSNNIIVGGWAGAAPSQALAIKYDENLTCLWNKTPAYGTTTSQVRGVATIGNEYIYAAGAKDGEVLTIKYDADGNHIMNFSTDVEGTDAARSIAIDRSGLVVVTGYAGSNDLDYLTIKYSNNTYPDTTQVVLNSSWGDYASTNSSLFCYAMGIDAEQTNLTVFYKWYNNSVEVDSLAGNTTILTGTLSLVSAVGKGNLTGNQSWKCSVQMSDGNLTEPDWNDGGPIFVYSVAQCGASLSANTAYVLDADAYNSSAGNCFTVGGNNIELDCKNYKIIGGATAGTAFLSTTLRTNFSLRNCWVQNFQYGVYRYFASSLLYNNTFNRTYTSSIYLDSDTSDNNNITANTFSNLNQSGFAIYLRYADNIIIHSNNFSNNRGNDVYTSQTSTGNSIRHNVVNKNSVNDAVFASGTVGDGGTIENNSIINAGTGSSSWAYDLPAANSPFLFLGNNNVDGKNATEYFVYDQDNLVVENLHHDSSVRVLDLAEFVAYNCNNLTLRNSNLTRHPGSAPNIKLYGVNNSQIYSNNINDSYYGMYIDNYNNNVSIYNNSILNSSNTGMYVDSSNNKLNVYNNRIENIKANADSIYLYSDANSTIANNTVSAKLYGIYIYAGSGYVIQNNRINTTSTGAAGIYVRGSASTNGYGVIENNEINSTTYGIELAGTSETYLTNLNISNNTIKVSGGTDIGLAAGTGQARIVNNTILCSDATERGIRLASSTSTHWIEDNIISGCGYGFEVIDGKHTITENNITSPGVYGILINNAGYAKIPLYVNITRSNIVDDVAVPYYWSQPNAVASTNNYNLSRKIINTGLTVVSSNNLIVNNSNFTGSHYDYGTAISIANSSGVNITNNYFQDFQWTINFPNSGHDSDTEYVAHNTFYSNYYGVTARTSIGAGAYNHVNHTYYNNTFNEQAYVAIDRRCSGGNRIISWNISHNTFFNDSSAANIYMVYSYGCNNSVYEYNIFNYTDKEAIRFASSGYSQIINNTFINSKGTSSTDYYIFLEDSSTLKNNITNNYFNGSGYTIYVNSDAGANNTISFNNVYNAGQAGIYVSSSTYQGVNNNTFCYNAKPVYFSSASYSYATLGWNNNSFCIVNLDPVNGSNTTDTTPLISFNATNIANTTECTAVIDAIESGTNITLGADNSNQGIQTNRTLSFAAHELNITCNNSYSDTAVPNSINFLVYSLNVAPDTAQVIVNSTYGTNFTEENLACHVNITDDSNTSLIVYYNWYNNSQLVSGLSGSVGISAGVLTNISLISSSITRISEDWTCEVKGWDGTSNESDWNNATLNVVGCGNVFNNLVLAESRTANNTCINIIADDIQLDCADYVITGNTTGNGVVVENGNRISVSGCSINNFTNGIYVHQGESVLIINTSVYNNSGAGIVLNTSDYINVTNCSIHNNSLYGVWMHEAAGGPGTGNIVYLSTIANNSLSGIFIDGGGQEYIINNTIRDNAEFGILIKISAGNEIINNTILNHSYNINLTDADDNIIYNNYLGDNPFADSGSTGNEWNTSRREHVNIIGGPYLGGNYWTEYNGSDSDGDGLGDTDVPWKGSAGLISSGGDSLPLTSNPNTMLVLVNSSAGTNYSDEDITCWANITDSVNASMVAYFRWYNNSVLFAEGSSMVSRHVLANISTIGSGNTSIGENWTCEVRAWDGFENESGWNNATITVLERPAPPAAAAGGGGGATRVITGGVNYSSLECMSDSDCSSDEFCLDHKCIKLFDVQILQVDSPIGPGEVLDFRYLIKGIGVFKGDVIVDFWAEKDGVKVISGSDVVYLGEYETKIVDGMLNLYKDMLGKYKLFVRISYNEYSAAANRPFEVVKDALLHFDLSVLNLTEQPLEFTVELRSNKDEEIAVTLVEKLVKDNAIVWQELKTVSFAKHHELREIVGPLEPGKYLLEVSAYKNNIFLSSEVRSFEARKEFAFARAVAGSLFIFAWIAENKCFVLFVLALLAAVSAMVCGIVYFLSRGRFKRAAVLGFVLAFVAAILILIKYLVCRKLVVHVALSLLIFAVMFMLNAVLPKFFRALSRLSYQMQARREKKRRKRERVRRARLHELELRRRQERLIELRKKREKRKKEAIELWRGLDFDDVTAEIEKMDERLSRMYKRIKGMP